MRKYFILFVLCMPVFADTLHVVCSSLTTIPDGPYAGEACTTTSFSSAMTASMADNKLVVLRAGDTFNVGSSFTLPPNASNVWARVISSRAHLPRPGYRVCHKNTPERPNCTTEPEYINSGNFAFIRLGSGVTFNTPILLIDITDVEPTTNVITLASGSGYTNGDRMAYTAAIGGRPLLCASVGPTYGGRCTANEHNNFIQESATGITDGEPARFFGAALPPELEQGGIYYIREPNVACTGCYRVSATPTGSLITFSTFGDAVYREYGPQIDAPETILTHNKAYYVCDKSGSTIKLSLTPPADGTCASSATGELDILSAAQDTGSFTKVQRVQNYHFSGISFRPQPGVASGVPLGLWGYSGTGFEFTNHVDSLPRNISFQHVDFGGQFGIAQTPGLWMDGDNFSMRDSYCDEIKANADSQCILQTTSRGNAVLVNNTLIAGGENYIAGGTNVGIRGVQPTNMRWHRNYFPKSLYWWRGIKLSTSGLTNQFRVTQFYTGSNCGTAASSSYAQRCFWHTKNGVRGELTTDQVFTVGASDSGSIAVGIEDDGSGGARWIARYTSGITLTGADEFTKTQEAGASIVWPADAVRICNVTVTSGAVTSGCTSNGSTGTVSNWITKNSFELKLGNHYEMIGNVFGPKWHDPAGGQSQGPTLHPQSTSGPDVAWAFWTNVRHTLWQHNIFFDLVTGFSLQKRTFHSSFSQSQVRDAGGHHAIINNLFAGNSNQMLGRYGSQWVNAEFTSNATVRNDTWHSLFDHNTTVDAELVSIRFGSQDGTTCNLGACDSDFSTHRNSIWIPTLRATSPSFPTVVSPGAGGLCGVRATNRDANGTWERIILMNRNGGFSSEDDVGTCGVGGADWPTGSTFLVNGTQNLVSIFKAWAEHTCDSVHSTSCVTRDSTTDLRIKAGSGFAAGEANDATDGRALGADIDEIEALTGPWGVDVIAGIPPFAVRESLDVSVGGTVAVFSYLPLAAGACDITIWDNAAYSGTPVYNDDDSGADVLGGRRVNRIGVLDASTRYWWKQRCPGGVAVGQFKTGAGDPPVWVTANGATLSAATVRVDEGSSPGTLNNGTPVACTAVCTVPVTGAYYRLTYLSGGSAVLGQSDIVARP